MSAELQATLEIIGAGILLRLWSNWEHRKSRKENQETSADVKEIKMYINGNLEKRLKEEYERGKADAKK